VRDAVTRQGFTRTVPDGSVARLVLGQERGDADAGIAVVIFDEEVLDLD